MAMSRIGGVILHKLSSIFARWLCTAKPVGTVKKKSVLFDKVSRLWLTPSSKIAVTDFLDKWVSEGNSVTRSDLLSLLGYYRNRKKYHLALQVFFFSIAETARFVSIWLRIWILNGFLNEELMSNS